MISRKLSLIQYKNEITPKYKLKKTVLFNTIKLERKKCNSPS